MKAVIVRPEKAKAEIMEIENNIETFQTICDGLVQPITIDHKTVVLCNEEGLIRDLKRNRILVLNNRTEFLRGTLIVIGFKGDKFCGLDDAEKWREKFSTRAVIL